MRSLQLLVAGALALSACSGSATSAVSDDEPTTQPAATASTTSSSVLTTSTTATSASSTSEPEVSITSDPTTLAESTTTVADEQAAASTLPPSSTGLVLERVGIGPLRFGASPEPAIEFLAGALGMETSDSGWGPAQSEFGACPGTEVRGVSFGPLTVLFGDPDGERVFYAWTYDVIGSPDLFGLATAEGIGIGSTRDDIDATSQDVEFDQQTIGSFADFDGLFGWLDPNGRVFFLGGGQLCE